MLSTVIGALLPVVVTLLLGVVAAWRGDVDMRAARVLNTMVLTYALPMLLFAGTVTTSRSSLAAELPLAGALLVGLVGPYIAALLIARYGIGRDLSASALTAMAFGFPAIPFTGIPILTPLVGDRATVVVEWAGIFVNVFVLCPTMVLLSIAQVRGKGEESTDLAPIVRDAIVSAAKQPVVFAPLAAILFVLMGIRVPEDLVSAMKLLGGAVGGVSLFASGAILQAQGVTFSVPALMLAVGRVLVVPGAAWLLLRELNVDALLTKTVVLALAIASAPMQVILAVRYEVCQKENAALLLYSNVLCIFSLMLFIYITQT